MSEFFDPDKLSSRSRVNPADIKTIEYLKSLVTEAGGEWCGVQTTFDGSKPLLLFNSPNSGSTLAIVLDYADAGMRTGALDASKIVNDIRKRLEESDKDFANRKISVKASVLENIHDTLIAISAELEQILGRKK